MSEPRDVVRLAIAGTGSVSQVVHLPVLTAREDAHVVAVADVDQPRARAIAERFGVPRVATDDEILNDPTVEGVLICTPNAHHADLAVSALSAGKHVLVERPMAVDTQGVEQVLAAARAADRALVVGMPHRYRSDAVALQSFVAGGSLGTAYSVRGRFLKRAMSITSANWRRRRSVAGGGALMDLGVPLADLCLWLIGYPKIRRVSAVTATDDTEVEDAAVVVAETENGIALSLEVSWNLFADEDHYMARVLGREGSGWLPPLKVFKQLGGRPLDVTPQQPERRENAYMASYRRLLDRFIRMVAGERGIELPEEQLVLMSFIEAAYRSAREQSEILIP